MVQEIAHHVEGVFLRGNDGRNVAVELLLASSTQLGGSNVLTGDLTNHVGASDIHFRFLVHGNHKVRGHRSIDGAASGLTHHDGNLRAAAGQRQLAAGDLGVHGQRGHRILDAGAAGILNANDRAANLDGHIHDLGNLLAKGHADRATVDGLIVSVDAHRAAGDAAIAGDHAIRIDGLRVTRGLAQRTSLDEGTLI